MELGADHLFAVDGVEAGQGSAPSSRAVAVQLGVGEAPRFILLQPVTPAVPRHPSVRTRRFRVHRGLWGGGPDGVSQPLKSRTQINMLTPDFWTSKNKYIKS